jgi:ATP-dependent DNA helicase RecG
MAESAEGTLALLSRVGRDDAGAPIVVEIAEALRALAGTNEARAVGLEDAARAITSAREALALSVAVAKAQRLVMACAGEAPVDARGGDAEIPKKNESAEARRKRRMNERRDKAREHAQKDAMERASRGELAGLDAPIETMPGIGPGTGRRLRERGLETTFDLVLLVPRRYDDERTLVPIPALEVGRRQVTVGVVSACRTMGGGRKRRAEVVLEPLPENASGRHGLLRLVWFNAPPGIDNRFPRGARFRVAGTVEEYRGQIQMAHPETSRLDADDAAPGGVVARYPDVPGVAPRILARAIGEAVRRYAHEVPEAVPPHVREARSMMSLSDALRRLHAPPRDLSEEALAGMIAGTSPEHARLAFEEFFLLELALHERRAEEARIRAEALAPEVAPLARARASLPFGLTGAQARVVSEIAKDLAREVPMRRLLQGDVGSGKTAVAMLAAAHAAACQAQTAIMAPTELLAEQHFHAFSRMGRALGLRVELVVGGARAAHKKKVRAGLEAGTVDVAVGTHALLSEGVRFRKLRLVVVDEQHRFGVGQRLRLVQKGEGEGAPVCPHLLVMTATPIPRSLALVLYGDLDASVLDEMPPGRVPPVTRAYPLERREEALRQLARALEKEGQAYVVCPMVEESEEVDLRAATTTYDEMRARFGDEAVALVHGRMATEERRSEMERFAKGEAKILVSTTVIEVGVDVPRANVIVVEHAERFGLAQLHQLRGRVGRGGQRSACLLVHDAHSEEARARIDVLCRSHDGFVIAEEDLRIRGPGELFGRRQSGLPGFRFGDLRRDLPLLAEARDAARALLADDPTLAKKENASARAALERLSRSPLSVVREEAG